jgi:hypothetical protein
MTSRQACQRLVFQFNTPLMAMANAWCSSFHTRQGVARRG